MSKALLRSISGLRASSRRVSGAFLQPGQSRYLSQTPHIIEPQTSPLPSATLSTRPPTSTPARATPSRSIPPPSLSNAANTPTTATSPEPSVRELLPLLAAQPGHYITAHIHGRPYLVTEGDKVRLPFKMAGVQPGDILRLNRASVLGSRDYTLKGAPYIDERLFECRAVVLGTEAEPMRVLIKKKQRTRRKKHVRSKHKYTILRIGELKVKGMDEMGA